MSETTGESTAQAGTGAQERGFVGRLIDSLVRVREVSILIVLSMYCITITQCAPRHLVFMSFFVEF